jgi:hypothetical protein
MAANSWHYITPEYRKGKMKFGKSLFRRNLLKPGHAGKLFLQRRLELGVAVGFESRPVCGGFHPLAIRGTKPEFHGHFSLADLGMFL